MNDMMSKEEALLYQKALITSKDREISNLKKQIGEADSEIAHWKHLSQKKHEPNEITELKRQLQSQLDKLRNGKMNKEEKAQIKALNTKVKELRKQINKLQYELIQLRNPDIT